MKYKKNVRERRRFIRKNSDDWETKYIEVKLGMSGFICNKSPKPVRTNQLKTYYRKKLDGLGLNVARLRTECVIDMLAGISLGALDESLLFNKDNKIE